MRERSMGEKNRMVTSNTWEKENQDAVLIIDKAIGILISDDANREKTIAVTANYLAKQPVDLLDLWQEDKRLGDYLRTKKELEGYMNDLRSAMDLARAKQLKKPEELLETDAEKIIGSVFKASKEEDRPAEDQIKKSEASVWPERFIEALIDAEKQGWEDFLNTAAAVNREKEFISNDEFNQLRKDLTNKQNRSAGAFTDTQRQYLRDFLERLEKRGQFDEFTGFYWTKHLKKTKRGR